MMFVHWKNYKKNCILLKTTVELPLFLISEVDEHIAAFEYYKYGLHDF